MKAVALAVVVALVAPVLAVCAGATAAPPTRHDCCPTEVTGALTPAPAMADACCRQSDAAATHALAPARHIEVAPSPDAAGLGQSVSMPRPLLPRLTGPQWAPPDRAVPKYLRFSVFLV